MVKIYSVMSVLALVWSTQPGLAAVTFGSAFVDAGSVANTDQDPGQYFDTEDDGYLIGPLATSESIAAANPSRGFNTTTVSAINYSTTTSSFIDPAHGIVDFSGNSAAAITAAGFSSDPQASAAAYGLNNFNYAFNTDTPIAITIAYSLKDNGLGSSDPEISIFSLGGGSSKVFLPVNGAGSETFKFFTPGKYNFSISSAAAENVSQTGVAGQNDAVMNDHYSFSIMSAVPEPATWLTMLVGFGAIGLGMRYGLRRHMTPA